MSESADKVIESLKELDDVEFEIMFIDNIYKKLKQLDKPDMRTETLLFVCYSVVEAIKKYIGLAKEGERTIPHEDVLNTILSKGEEFLTLVANDEDKALYSQKTLSELREWSKSLLFVLKKELLERPKYAHLQKS